MTIARLALAALIFAGPAAASPLGVSDLADLARAGLDEAAIIRLVEAEGLSGSLGAQDALTLREAGMSASLVSRLIRWNTDDGIEVEERDGAVVISGSGLPPGDEAEAREPSTFEEVPMAAGEEPYPYYEDREDQAAGEGPGHPVGAVFGWSGGAVFLPARFGGSRPSAFGRTIVAGAGPYSPWLGMDMGVGWPVMPGFLAAPQGRWITISTSRGEIRVPN